jgi:hypothetical protein
VDGNAAQVVTSHLHLTGVQARPDLDPQPTSTRAYGLRATHASCWAVKRAQDAVASRFHFPAAEPPKFLSDHVVVAVEQIVPGAIASLDSALGRSDNVGEQYGGEDAISARLSSEAREELLDFIDDGIAITRVREVIAAGQLNEARIREVVHKVAREINREQTVCPMHDACR